MAKKTLGQILTDAPVDQLMNWMGFSAKRDKTMLPPNWLVGPSQNCLVPDGDKVLPREGTQVVFQGDAPIIDDEGTIGGYTKYKNFFGVEMDVKAYRDATAGEQVLVLFNDVYVPITITPNLSENGTEKIYFATYTDTNLDFSQNKRIPRLCWVNEYATNDNVPKGRVFSWTGGITTIATIVGNIITIPAGQTFRKLGFTDYFFNGALTGEIHATINGVDYFSTDLSELDGDTLTLNAAPAAVVGDIVSSTVEVDELVAPMQMLRMSKNYMYYGSEMLRQWFMSNQFGRPENVVQTGSNAELDDMNVVSLPSDYTGTNLNKYRVQIVAVDPAVDTQSFTPSGGGANSGYFVTSGYNGSGKHKYKLTVVTDVEMTPVGASVTGSYTHGQVFEGGTSGCRVQLVAFTGGSVAGGAHFKLLTPGVYPSFGENFADVTNPANNFDLLDNAQLYNTVVLYKDGIQVITGGMFDGVIQLALPGSYALVDGLTFTVSTAGVGGNIPGDYYELEINTGSPDEFGVSKNGGPVVGSTPIDGSPQAIGDGIEVEFTALEGHAIGDYWDISANRGVSRPWADFYYTLDFNTQQSARRPGEGYIYDIPSPFWTMDTFEDSMFLNTTDGNWGYTKPTLSADLKSEDISFTPLKQVGSSKVLYQYLTGHSRNDLLYIDENRNLQSLGRRIMMEKLQAETMSNDVLNKFQSLSFLNGSILFQDNNINITSPEDNTMMVWNERKGYWQPPQVIPNLGLLTIIGTDLYVHSTLDTATRRLNDPTANGDDGVEYEVIIRNSTYDHGNRWMKKTANMGFWEGYVSEAPPMKMNLYLDPDGCAGIKKVDITPIPCCEPTNAGNFGGGNDGNHEFGGAETHSNRYARYQWDKLGVVNFYFSSLEFRCRTKKHTYEVLSMGINLAQSKFNNKEYRPTEDPIDSLLPL